MKSIIYNIIGLVLGMSWLTGCSEQEFTTFQGEKTGIYMANVNSRNEDGTIAEFVDSISFSFASSKDTEKQISKTVTVRLMGNVTSYDRPFALKVDETKSTAIRGTHFDFAESDCVIPANKSTKDVPIVVYRHPDLLTKTLCLELFLKSNEHFTLELENYKSKVAVESKGKELCGSSFRLFFSEFYTATTWWNTKDISTRYLGAWSASKEKRVNAIMGWSHADWEAGISNIPSGRVVVGARLLRKELQEAANAGTPIIDDNGKYMQLGSSFLVDYSAYDK